jgi:ABC-type dipeptide/oligopeptide/nickel transport system permease component
MFRILANRLLAAVFVIWGVVTMVFLILRVLPGDPAALALGFDATPEALAALRQQMGLDQPIIVQYFIFLADVIRGNFGDSLFLQEPALQLVLDRLPATFQLAIPALILAVLVALPLGVLAGSRSGSLADRIISVMTLGAQSIPNFWIGLMLILILARNFGLLPTSGRGNWQHMIMPVITLSLPLLAVLTRFTRTGMLENLQADYVRTARSKGLKEQLVYYRHIFKNMLIPVITTLGLQAGTLLGGAVVIEIVFAWPGLGRLTVDSILRRDYPVVQVAVLVIALLVVLVNLTVDLFYTVVDPRIRVK